MYVIKSDNYFINSASKGSSTSNNTLEKLKNPCMQHDQLRQLISNDVTIKHKTYTNKLSSHYKTEFSKWLSFLHCGFNVIIYGLGSKMALLQEFRRMHLKKAPAIVINGFFPAISIKNVTDTILDQVLDLKENPANTQEACELIVKKMSVLPNLHLYIILHNIEGTAWKSSKNQNMLARLTSVPTIHLIASIDHVNGPLLWDYSRISQFNFMWINVTSFEPYINETSFESSLMVQQSKSLALSSLRNVFLSLTSNSKAVYLLIANYHLKHSTNQHYEGYLFKDLYWACREAFLVSSDLALRSQLNEFVDHKMIKYRRGTDGSEYVTIPISNAILQQFVDEQ